MKFDLKIAQYLFLASVINFSISLPVSASNELQDTKVVQISVNTPHGPEYSSYAYIIISGTLQNLAQCAAGSSNRLAIDPETSAGQAMLQVALEAFRGGRAVDVSGSGFCKSKSDSEELSAILLKNTAPNK